MSRLNHRLSFFFFSLSVLGLYLSETAKAIPSIAMAGFIICAIVSVIQNGIFETRKDMLVLAGSFLLLYSIQWLTSDNYSYLLERIRIKLPFLLLPIALMVIPPFRKVQLLRLGIVFIVITTSIALFITVRFLAHYQYYIELISQSQVVPGPINHIRFSLMTVTSAYLAYNLNHETKLISSKSLRLLLNLIIGFLIIFIHIYSVRSGMLALYAVILYILISKFSKRGNLKQRLTAAIVFISLPFLAYLTSDAIRQKVKASVYDYYLYKANKSNEHNSLGKRFVSYEVALEVFGENPLLGCGIGDLEDINKQRFASDHQDVQTVIIPHNQFIYYLMGSGLIGTLIFTIGFLFPLFFQQNYKWQLLSVQYLLLILSFQTEPMLETQLGVAYSLLFILFSISWIRSSNTTEF